MPVQDEQQLIFPVEQGGERLDRFLAQHLTDASRVEVQRWIKEERVTVNGRPGKASAKLAAGEHRRPAATGAYRSADRAGAGRSDGGLRGR